MDSRMNFQAISSELKTWKNHTIPPDNKPGVYFLYAQGELIYIGRSNDVLRRIKEHEKRFVFDYAEMVQIDDPVFQDIYETWAINYYQPKYNREKVYRYTPQLTPQEKEEEKEIQERINKMILKLNL